MNLQMQIQLAQYNGEEMILVYHLPNSAHPSSIPSIPASSTLFHSLLGLTWSSRSLWVHQQKREVSSLNISIATATQAKPAFRWWNRIGLLETTLN